MIFSIVVYETDTEGRRLREHGHTSLLTPANLRSTANTLNDCSNDDAVTAFAGELENILDAL